MPLKKRDVRSGLTSKGFEIEDNDHTYFRYITGDGRRTSIFTHFSHGSANSDIHDGLVSIMARQCKVSTGQFKRLVSCELAQQGYEELLLANGILESEPPRRNENST